jgi:hypothetical protein
MKGAANLFVPTATTRPSPVPSTSSELVQNPMEEPGNVTTDAEYGRQLRRAAQRERRRNESPLESDSRRRKNSASRRAARGLLSEDRRIDIQRTDMLTRAVHRGLLDDQTRTRIRVANMEAPRTSRSVQSGHISGEMWWNRVAALNASETAQPLHLHWNRTCRICGIKVCYKSALRYSHLTSVPIGFDGRKNPRQMFCLRSKWHSLSATTPTLSSRVGLLH